MRATGVLFASALCLCAGAALATPLAKGVLSAPGTPLIEVHHKPGHAGGPPWMRGRQDRNEGRADRQYDRGYSNHYSERRTACRTVYRSYYDAYAGEYLRRSARVCD
jgi:hypothetical protein